MGLNRFLILRFHKSSTNRFTRQSSNQLIFHAFFELFLAKYFPLKQIRSLFLSTLSGFLLFASWPVSPFTVFIFFALVPLLWLELFCRKRIHFFLWTYIALLVWNAATTWWMCNASLPGGISAILANSLLMSIPWIGFYNVKRRMGETMGYASLILFWMSFEYIHLNWELSWPWLTMGNVFATHPDWVQWYEYSGTSGGTCWILCTNLLIFLSMRKGQGVWVKNKYAMGILLIIIIPFSISYAISKKTIPVEAGSIRNIVIIQPNVDPWNEKFVAGSEEAQVHDLIRLSETGLDAKTALIVWPETAIPASLNEDSLRSTDLLHPIWDFLKAHPNINLLTGIEGYRIFTEKNKTGNSQKIQNSPYYFESYNSSALLDSDQFQVYHKSRLVPGAETLPSFIHFLAAWFEKFGGTTGSYVRQDDRTVFRSYNHSYAIAPAICYESIYGEFMAEYVKGGAGIIAIETNDGWWGNTPGYKQHESYARLRAIETRRWVVRSANTGISCFINPKGKVIDAQPWDKKAVIKLDVPQLTCITFFVSHGDILSRIAIAASLLLIFWNFFDIIRAKRRRV